MAEKRKNSRQKVKFPRLKEQSGRPVQTDRGTGLIPAINRGIADRLKEVARLLGEQGSNPFRAQAYRHGAETLEQLETSVEELYRKGGLEDLQKLPGIGESLARSIRDLLLTGRLPMLDRLRGEAEPVALFSTVPGIGKKLAERLHHDLEIDTLEELELAAFDGRLKAFRGIGEKRLAGIIASLANRLGRVRPPREEAHEPRPSVTELLDVDREYREKVEAGILPTVAPRRFNPKGEAWLPVLHTQRGARHYTALFSNTARAHQKGKARDWVVLFYDDGKHESQCTIITAEWGALEGRRIVRGREAECLHYYGERQ